MTGVQTCALPICRHATVYLISSSLFLPAVLHPDRSPGGAFFSVRILVPLLYSFITFRLYEAHFETRKNEPLRIDNPFQNSHCLSRITFIFTSPVSTSVLLSLAEHQRCFSGWKLFSRVVTLWQVLPCYMSYSLKTVRIRRLLSRYPWQTQQDRNQTVWGSDVNCFQSDN